MKKTKTLNMVEERRDLLEWKENYSRDEPRYREDYE